MSYSSYQSLRYESNCQWDFSRWIIDVAVVHQIFMPEAWLPRLDRSEATVDDKACSTAASSLAFQAHWIPKWQILGLSQI
jgi:hypothetical protein